MPDPVARPNILLITTDQQRHDTCGPDAPPFMRTPHFDHLTREGVRFRRAYADCPICVPSRVTIMSGRTIYSHGMTHFGDTRSVLENDDSLPNCLNRLGYHTIAVGKMHFSPQRSRHGFQEMIIPDDYYRWMRTTGHPYQPMRHGLGQNELYPGMATVPESLTLTSWTAEQCVQYIRERRDPNRPFFMWCSFSKPHPPLDPPEPYYSMYRDCDIPEPVFGDWSDDGRAPEQFKRNRQLQSYDMVPPQIIREARAAYYGLITQNDYNMGWVFAALQDRGLFNETLILYTSDHGEYLGDHHSGGKLHWHEPSAHVPFAMRLPRSWEPRLHGTTSDALVTLADILPTVVRAAGGEPPEAADGQDLVAVARGEHPAPRDALFGACGSGDPIKHYYAITDGRWKYIHYTEGPCEQLFDLQNDPRELTNLAEHPEHVDVRHRLRDRLIEHVRATQPDWLEDDRLPQRPPAGDSEADRRSRFWPGYHTDLYEVDVRH